MNEVPKRVGPMAWVFLMIAIVCDATKVLLFFINLIPAVGQVIDVVGSFFISIVEIVVVFGGLWFIGLYKPGKNSTSNILMTMGLSAFDAVPILDDLPLTSPGVAFMILRTKAADAAAAVAARSTANENDPRERRATA